MIKESFCLVLLLAVCHSYPAKDQETEFYGGGVQDRGGVMRVARSPLPGGGGTTAHCEVLGNCGCGYSGKSDDCTACGGGRGKCGCGQCNGGGGGGHDYYW